MCQPLIAGFVQSFSPPGLSGWGFIRVGTAGGFLFIFATVSIVILRCLLGQLPEQFFLPLPAFLIIRHQRFFGSFDYGHFSFLEKRFMPAHTPNFVTEFFGISAPLFVRANRWAG